MTVKRELAVGGATFLVLVVRGGLLWVALPVACLCWVLLIVPALVLRLAGIHAALSPRTYMAFATRTLDCVLSRLFPGTDPLPWPWRSTDWKEESGVLDMW